jgi:hypothetical protein
MLAMTDCGGYGRREAKRTRRNLGACWVDGGMLPPQICSYLYNPGLVHPVRDATDCTA